MLHTKRNNPITQTLQRANIIWYISLLSVAMALGLCISKHAIFSDIGNNLPLIGIRTLGYCLAIGIFPLLRVYRGRPLQGSTEATADHALLCRRYCSRILISMCGAELMLLAALLLCLLGDDQASFYLISALSLLAMVLYKPQAAELKELAENQPLTDQAVT